ncbi:hypothetical protein SEF58_03330 [Neomoorella humiferrea]|uniref:Uncharacterized protein n=1 Tax=Neomoorella humiferrea TaxID=676965 RepID=A0A2T0AM28_9FIRM|nr:hypothetical protein [Moorella humiferrea]PRR69751.1 hypothetical protein MOHU_22910 [Moorella humiferrea]
MKKRVYWGIITILVILALLGTQAFPAFAAVRGSGPLNGGTLKDYIFANERLNYVSDEVVVKFKEDEVKK